MFPTSNTRLVLATALCSLALVACGPSDQQTPPEPQAADSYPGTAEPQRDEQDNTAEVAATGDDNFTPVQQAIAELQPTDDGEARGTVSFNMAGDGSEMRVSIELSGLSPGEHGFHIHSTPDCSDGGKAAGGHFNPHQVDHGAPSDDSQHVGDLGNVTANEEGRVSTSVNSKQLAFTGSNNILNRAVVVHADADDLSSQPSGAAGSRISCGVIESVQEAM